MFRSFRSTNSVEVLALMQKLCLGKTKQSTKQLYQRCGRSIRLQVALKDQARSFQNDVCPDKHEHWTSNLGRVFCSGSAFVQPGDFA